MSEQLRGDLQADGKGDSARRRFLGIWFVFPFDRPNSPDLCARLIPPSCIFCTHACHSFLNDLFLQLETMIACSRRRPPLEQCLSQSNAQRLPLPLKKKHVQRLRGLRSCSLICSTRLKPISSIQVILELYADMESPLHPLVRQPVLVNFKICCRIYEGNRCISPSQALSSLDSSSIPVPQSFVAIACVAIPDAISSPPSLTRFVWKALEDPKWKALVQSVAHDVSEGLPAATSRACHRKSEKETLWESLHAWRDDGGSARGRGTGKGETGDEERIWRGEK